MTREDWIRVAGLYLPISAALMGALLHSDRRRQFAACLLSSLWTLPALLIVQRLNQSAHWWAFSASDTVFRGMPLELYLGWAVLWGLVPQLAFPRLPIAWSAAIMIAVDLIAMPACAPAVYLSPYWLAGESVAALLVLLPALCIAQWTREDRRLFLRAMVQIAISGMTFLFLLPEMIFALRPGDGWAPLLHTPGWLRQLALQAIALLAVPGISAVLEFAERGRGTPIPYDPPQRLVTSGIYRYVANPMQISCGVVMAAWAILLHNGWMALAATFSFVYSAGIAEWDEGEDLRNRFGAEWTSYRAAVRNWVPRWRPYYSGPAATLYIAETCGPCSELRMWLEARSPIGLGTVAAEQLPTGSIRRLRYVPRRRRTGR
jgi:protein-S-isoprenylcysteine O-methyltransferase Ste14